MIWNPNRCFNICHDPDTTACGGGLSKDCSEAGSSSRTDSKGAFRHDQRECGGIQTCRNNRDKCNCNSNQRRGLLAVSAHPQSQDLRYLQSLAGNSDPSSVPLLGSLWGRSIANVSRLATLGEASRVRRGLRVRRFNGTVWGWNRRTPTVRLSLGRK